MAQIVTYGENNVEYTEGPFVVCAIGGDKYRVEAQRLNHVCPVIPDDSVIDMLATEMGFTCACYKDCAKCALTADWLNRRVRSGVICLSGNVWVAKGY